MNDAIPRLLELPDEDLFDLLGADLLGTGARESLRPGRIALARRWLGAQKAALRETTFSDPRIRAAAEGSAVRRRALLVAAIADV